MANKRILKINNSWTELFNFQNSFYCHKLELLRTAPLPIHKVIIIDIFLDGMNGIYLYFINKHFLVGRYWDFNYYKAPPGWLSGECVGRMTWWL